MATFNKFNVFTYDCLAGKHDFSTQTYKVALTNSAPSAANTGLADITQVANGNGYTTGGTSSSMSLTTSSGVAKVTATDVVFTASGGSMGPFRYVVIYNDTTTGDPLVAYYDYGSSITLGDGETFTVDFDGTNGFLTIT